MVATSTGLVAYSGSRAGNADSADFTPVADYPGLTGSIRAKLTEMKVTPVKADIADDRPLITAADTRGRRPRSSANAPRRIEFVVRKGQGPKQFDAHRTMRAELAL